MTAVHHPQPASIYRPRRFEPSKAIAAVFVAMVATALLAPIVVVFALSVSEQNIMSFPPVGFTLKWFSALFESDIWSARLVASLEVGLISAFFATVLGTSLALGLQRTETKGKSIILGLGLLPLIVPSVTIGIGMYLVWVLGWSVGPIKVGGNLNGTLIGYVLADTVLALPYPLITVSASLLTVDRNLERAAASLGAGPWTTFRRIVFPLILPGVLAGFVLAFLTSWDEVVVAALMATPSFSTIPVELFSEVRQSPTPTAAALSTMLIIAGIAGFALIGLLQRRGRKT
jgi:putative spermidine/putrescine transport system permease protein